MKTFLKFACALACAIPLFCSCSGSIAVFPADGSRNVNPDTRLVLTFNSDGTPVKAPAVQGEAVPMLGAVRIEGETTVPVPSSGKIRVFDCDARLAVDSLDLSVPAGPAARRKEIPGTPYATTPYSYGRTSMPTNRDTRPGTPSYFAAEPNQEGFQLNIIGGFTDAFHFYPVILEGRRATISLHNNVLEYGHRYRVEIEEAVFGKALSWTFTCKAKAPEGNCLTVNADGSGDFSTLQGALDFIPDWSGAAWTIDLSEGDFTELVYARNKSGITIRGAGMEKTRIHYANNEVFNPHPLKVKTHETPGTFPQRRAPFTLDNCRDISLEDFTVATDLKGQAEGIMLNGERFSMRRVHVVGDGDAVQANGSVYMEECEVDGGGDTFLGRGPLFAYRCTLRNGGGPFTWVRNTEGVHGDVFVECSFESTGPFPADFGRSFTNNVSTYPYAEVAVIDCRLRNIAPEGWDASQLRPGSQLMLEYNSTDADSGAPSDVSRRNPQSRQLRMPEDSALISCYRNPAWVLDGWDPR